VRRRTSASVALVAILGLVVGTTAASTSAAGAAAGDPGSRSHVTRSAHPGGVEISRDRRGRVSNLSTDPLRPITVPDATLAAQVHPAALAAARAHVRVLSASLGVTDPARNLATDSVRSLAGARSVVRLTQKINGVEAFAARVVVGLDSAGSLQSVASRLATTPASMSAKVSATAAATIARATIAVGSQANLTTTSSSYVKRSVLDPTVLGLSTGASRLTWRVGVTSTKSLESSGDVFVDAATGKVLLTIPWAKAALNRLVCDRNTLSPEFLDQALCSQFVPVSRTEGGLASGNLDVDTAYSQLGRASVFYQGKLGVDLTNTVGSSDAGLFGSGSAIKFLRASTRACITGETDVCPMDNAFFAGAQNDFGQFIGGAMFFGQGYAAGDDIVAHELTHGVTDATSELLYENESGAINESMSDVFGELVDQANDDGAADQAADASWQLAEDLPIGPIRSMSNPTLYLGGIRQPDKMSSPYWYTGANDAKHDNGGVHYNSGVGNKTAYLIGHGGTFNGVTVDGLGIDQGSGQAAGIQKMAALYWDVENHLLPGASYADLGRQLAQSAAQLGWTGADLQTVKKAVSATELNKLATSASVSATRVKAGTRIRVTVKTTTLRGAAASGVAVRLYRRDYRTSTYTLYDWRKTGSTGTYSWYVTPPATTRYYATIAPGQVGSGPSRYTSPVVVNAVVSAGARTQVAKGRYLRVSGKVSPAGGQLLLQRIRGSSWVTIARALTYTTGYYYFRVKFNVSGYQYLRVVDIGTSWHGTGVSRTLKTRVV